jgi:D-alanyl-D-alanine carboxypeptidase/D-alanyl-D-alanine-endopeptidase (penicillin-binding protein 4)
MNRLFRPTCHVLLLASLALCSLPALALPEAFSAALREAGIPPGRVAVVIQPVDAPAPLLAHNAEHALNPASVMKLVTSFAALEQLGPAYTWTTELWANGPISNGRLEGNLVIKGKGDPSLTLERLWLMQRELRSRGIRDISGDLVLDTSHFNLPQHDPAAFDNEPLALYNAAPGALVANFNATTLRLVPDDSQVAVAGESALPGVALISQLELAEGECNNWRGGLKPRIASSEPYTLIFEGRYPQSCGGKTLALNIFDAAASFDHTFRALWAESGGNLGGSTVFDPAPTDTLPLISFSSVPLADALRSLNKHSNNLMTRNLYLTLGAEAYGAPATPEKGDHAIRAVLARHAIPTQKLVLENGSGLSRIERISADALNQLLLAAYRSPYFSEFESALPIVALDGTLKRRFRDSPLSGRAHLKTGTLRDVNALAGYLVDVHGRRVSFVMLINHPNAARAEAAQRALLEWAQTQPAQYRERTRWRGGRE